MSHRTFHVGQNVGQDVNGSEGLFSEELQTFRSTQNELKLSLFRKESRFFVNNSRHETPYEPNRFTDHILQFPLHLSEVFGIFGMSGDHLSFLITFKNKNKILNF